LSVTAEISEDGKTVEVRFGVYNPEHILKMKGNDREYPGVPTRRFVPEEKGGPYWRLNKDLTTMRRLREAYGEELTVGKKLRAWGHEEVSKETNLADISQADDAELENISAELEDWMRPYQRADSGFMSKTNVLNTNQPRAGKTPETIAAIIEAEMEDGYHLVSAPRLSLRQAWEDAIWKVFALHDLGKELKSKTLSGRREEALKAYAKVDYVDPPLILTGDTPKERKEAIKQAKELYVEGEVGFWLLINPAMCRMKNVNRGTKMEPVWEQVLIHPELAEIGWDTFTIDEYHLMGLSNPKTLGRAGHVFIAEQTQPERRYALSGTPMGGKPIKLWGGLNFIDPPRFPSKWNWARQWLVVNKVEHNKEGDSHQQIEGIMEGREIEFYEHLEPYLVRRTTREALPGLPPRNVEDVWCEMTPKQAEQYKTFLTEAEWRLSDAEDAGRLTATNILAEYTRLKQFAGSYCDVTKTGRHNSDGDAVLAVTSTEESGKLIDLMEKLEELGVTDKNEKAAALIFSQNNSMVAMVAGYLNRKGIKTGIVTGEVKDKDRNAIHEAFQSGDQYRCIVMQTMSATALTWDAPWAESLTGHLLDETWVPDNQEQAEGRMIPTTEELMESRVDLGYYYYRTEGTIEEDIRKLNAEKALNNRQILDLRRRMQAEAKRVASELG
jgi:SNF2 family DNA or RNA helicase